MATLQLIFPHAYQAARYPVCTVLHCNAVCRARRLLFAERLMLQLTSELFGLGARAHNEPEKEALTIVRPARERARMMKNWS